MGFGESHEFPHGVDDLLGRGGGDRRGAAGDQVALNSRVGETVEEIVQITR